MTNAAPATSRVRNGSWAGRDYPAYEDGYLSGLHARARAVPARYTVQAVDWLRGFDNGHRGRVLTAWQRATRNGKGTAHG